MPTKAALLARVQELERAFKVEIEIVRTDAYRRGYATGLRKRPDDDTKAYQRGYRAACTSKK